VPGIGQGQVFLLDDEGNRIINPDGSAATAWPIQVDADSLIKKLVLPLVKMLVTQKDNGFTDFASKAVAEAFGANATDYNGQPVNRVETVKYPRSVARCSPRTATLFTVTYPSADFQPSRGKTICITSGTTPSATIWKTPRSCTS
jgi:hypothetical protein